MACVRREVGTATASTVRRRIAALRQDLDTVARIT
jgi:hypothetical protein